MAVVRYIVDDVDEAISFYVGRLNFNLDARPAPGFAMVSKGDLRLALNAPGGPSGGGQRMPDGTMPAPGGAWNRIQVSVGSIEAAAAELAKSGTRFRNQVVIGRGGRQVLIEDPAGNLVEVFESLDQPR